MYKTPPKWFVRALKSFDPDLRVRWSYENKKFIIERKTDKRGLYKPVKYIIDKDGVKEVLLPEKSDRYIQYHDGYAGILYTNKLNENLLNHLKSIDTWSKNKSLDELVSEYEHKEKEKKEKKVKDEINAFSREIWDYWNNRGYFNKGGVF